MVAQEKKFRLHTGGKRKLTVSVALLPQNNLQ
jgi:hypothetical protein